MINEWDVISSIWGKEKPHGKMSGYRTVTKSVKSGMAMQQSISKKGRIKDCTEVAPLLQHQMACPYSANQSKQMSDDEYG